MSQVDLKKKIEACEKHAKEIANPDMRVFKDSDIPVGKHVFQGDVAIIRIAEVPATATAQPARTNRQIVEGTTRGSRHCVSVESMATTKFFIPANKGELVGDIISSKTHDICITHPEHGNVQVPPGTYQIKFQRSFSPLQELKRQRD